MAKAVTQKILGREAIPVYVVMDRQASKDIEAAAATAGIARENYMGRKILGQVAEREPTWDEMEQVRVKLIVVDHADILERVEVELEADEDWLTETLKERLTAQ